MIAPTLVVDIGTTSCAAVLVTDAGAEPMPEAGVGGTVSWPAAVIGIGDEVVIGSRAARYGARRPEHLVEEFKRLLGSDEQVSVGERAETAERLVGRILAELRAEAARRHGGPVDRVLLTVPSAFLPRGAERRQMLAAGHAAGFREVELLDEPVATAYAPVDGPDAAPGETLLVYDWGGGTFDAALVEVAADGGRTVRGVVGLLGCGGRDLDQAIADEVLGGRPGAARGLRDVKHDLAYQPQIEEMVDDGDALVPVTVDRAMLLRIARPLIDRTVTACRGLLVDADVDPAKVDALVLSGGASRLDGLAAVLDTELGMEIRPVRDRELAVVQGAARWATLAPGRTVTAQRPPLGTAPLRWTFPGDIGTLLRWDVGEGSAFPAGAVLGVVQLLDGALWTLRADRPGIVVQHHVRPGADVVASSWLLTSRIDVDAPGAVLTEPEVVVQRRLTDVWQDLAFTPDRCVLVRGTATGIEAWDVLLGEMYWRAEADADRVRITPDGLHLLVTPRARIHHRYELSRWEARDDDPSRWEPIDKTIPINSNFMEVGLTPDSKWVWVLDHVNGATAVRHPLADLVEPLRYELRVANYSSRNHYPVRFELVRRLGGSSEKNVHLRIIDRSGDLAVFQSRRFSPSAQPSGDPVVFPRHGPGRAEGNLHPELPADKYLASEAAQNPPHAVIHSDGNAWPLTGAPGQTRSLLYSPDGTTLAAGWTSGWVSLHRVTDGETLAVLTHGPAEVEMLAFSSNGDRLAAYGGALVSVWALTERGAS